MKSRTAVPCRAAVVSGLLALAHLTCHQAILTAPAGSTLLLFVNPAFIPAHGGVSVVSALVLEPAGTPVPDGTVVQFFTTLGRINEQGKTNDGVARVNLIADSRSGTAEVTATSGPATQKTDVRIGSVLPETVRVSASPVRLTGSRTSQVTALVLDASGNFVANTPVFFSVSGSPAGDDFMESGGAPRITDNSGIARDVFRTRAGFDAASYTINVRAVTANNKTGETQVRIN